jgi:hypothetical protein
VTTFPETVVVTIPIGAGTAVKAPAYLGSVIVIVWSAAEVLANDKMPGAAVMGPGVGLGLGVGVEVGGGIGVGVAVGVGDGVGLGVGEAVAIPYGSGRMMAAAAAIVVGSTAPGTMLKSQISATAFCEPFSMPPIVSKSPEV